MFLFLWLRLLSAPTRSRHCQTDSDLGRQQQQRANLHGLLEEDVVNSHQTGPTASAAADGKQAFKDEPDDLTHTYPSAHRHRSPVGAGVGPAQLVGFPHQKTSKDAVEDVSLLQSGEKMSLDLKTFIHQEAKAKKCAGKHIGDILKVTPGPFPPCLPPSLPPSASVVTCGWQISSPFSLASSIQTEFGGKTRLRKLTVLDKKATISHKHMLEYCSKHQPTPAGVILCVQRVEEQTVHDGSLLLSWRHLQQGSGTERHAAQLVS